MHIKLLEKLFMFVSDYALTKQKKGDIIIKLSNGSQDEPEGSRSGDLKTEGKKIFFKKMKKVLDKRIDK